MSSPFKVLDAYGSNDLDIFFGRDAEIDMLYRKTTESNVVLVYGASGTGKTSLINCGFAKKMEQQDWLPLYVRRKDDLLASIREEIQKKLPRKLKGDAPLMIAVKALHLSFFRPIYLIFDQFEELFISGSNEERKEFYEFVQMVLRSEFNCKLFFVMREEYLASLSEFEDIIPTLFEHRVRIERMRKRNGEEVVSRSAEAFDISIEKPELTIPKILERVSQNNLIELTHLQIYLDKLYTKAAAEDSGSVVFTPDLVDSISRITDVLNEFLEDQIKIIQQNTETDYRDSIWDVLKTLITSEGTRTSKDLYEARREMLSKGLETERIDFFLEELMRLRVVQLYDNRIELAHDSLANAVFEKLTAEDQTLARIRANLRDAYDRFKEFGFLLSKDELAYIMPYLDEITLSKGEQQVIDKSLAQQRQNRVWLFGMLGSTFLLISAFAVWALWERDAAIDRRDLLRDKNNEIEEKNIDIEKKVNTLEKTNEVLDLYMSKYLSEQDELRARNQELKQAQEDLERRASREAELRKQAEKSEEEAVAAREEAKALSRAYKAQELSFRALAAVEKDPNYALRVAVIAYQIEKSFQTEKVVAEVIERGRFIERYKLNVSKLEREIQRLLDSGEIPPLTKRELVELGLE